MSLKLELKTHQKCSIGDFSYCRVHYTFSLYSDFVLTVKSEYQTEEQVKNNGRGEIHLITYYSIHHITGDKPLEEFECESRATTLKHALVNHQRGIKDKTNPIAQALCQVFNNNY